MISIVEVRVIKDQEELNNNINKFKEIIQRGGSLTISWKKSKFDLFNETYTRFGVEQYQNILLRIQMLENLERELLSTSYQELLEKVQITLGQLHYQNGQFQAALSYVNKLKDKNSNEIQELFRQLIRDNLQTLDVKEVLDILEEKSLYSDIDQQKIIETYEELNIICQKTNNTQCQQIILTKLLELKNPQNVSKFMSYKLGEIAVDLKDYEQALQQWKEALNLVNNVDEKIQLLSNIGGVYSKMNQLENAIMYYIDVIQLIREFKKDDLTLYSTKLQVLGDVYRCSQQYSNALQIYEEILQIKQLTPNTFIGLANIHCQIGQIYKLQKQFSNGVRSLQQALEYFRLEKLINYIPDVLAQESICHDFLGECFRSQKRLNDAEKSFTDSLFYKEQSYGKLNKQTVYTQINLATTLFQLGKLQLSKELFLEILQTQLELQCECDVIGSTYNNIASVLFAMKQYQEALTNSDKAIEYLQIKYPADNEILKKVKALRQRIQSHVQTD